MAKAYWIAHVDVRDPERYKDYIATATPAYKEFGATFLVRGGAFMPVEGTARSRNVIIEFPSYEAAVACYESETYQRARAIRHEVSDGDIMIIKGYES